MANKPLIYLEQFYHLRPDLRENEEFQSFLTTINTGEVGYTKEDIYFKNIPANLVLDSDELAMFYKKYPANHNAIYASLWEYAETLMPPDVFETVVKRDFLPHAEITGNIFADLGNELQYALEQLQQGNAYKSEIFSSDIDQPKQARFFISTSYRTLYPLVAYYGNLMNYSPQEMLLQVIRVLNEVEKSETNYFHDILLYDKQKKEIDFSPLIQIIDNLKTAGEKETRDHFNPSTEGVLLPDWASDWPENPSPSLIEDTLFNFYIDLTTVHSHVEEGLSGLQAKWTPQLYKKGLSASLVSALFSYDPQNSSTHFGQVREKVNLLIEAGGYKIIELKNYFKANKNLYILGKEKTVHTYRGVASPSQKLASYTIIAYYPKESITLTENQALNVDYYPQITDLPFVLDIIGFDEKFLSPLKKTDEGKKLLTEVFGPGLSMDKKTFDQFTETLQITSALSSTPEAITGGYNAEQAIIDAIAQSDHPAQIFIYLYSLLFGPLQKFQSLQDAILSILEKLNIPHLQTNATSDDALIVQAQGTIITRTSIEKDMFSNEVLATLSFIFDEEKINRVNRQTQLERYLLFAQQAGVKPPKKLSDDEISFEPYQAEQSFLESCEFILSESEFYSHPEFYYEISEAAITKTREHTPRTSVKESKGIPLAWFEKEAQKMGLSWEKFVLADTNQNGELSFTELFEMEMEASEKTIYERVMQKHHLQIAPRFRKFLKQNPFIPMISADGMPRSLTKIAYRNAYLGSSLDDLADDYPFQGLIQLFNPRYNMDITRDPAQALLHKYPLGVKLYLSNSELGVQIRIQKILDSKQNDSKKLEKIKVLLLKHVDDPQRSQSLFMVGSALPQIKPSRHLIKISCPLPDGE